MVWLIEYAFQWNLIYYILHYKSEDKSVALKNNRENEDFDKVVDVTFGIREEYEKLNSVQHFKSKWYQLTGVY